MTSQKDPSELAEILTNMSMGQIAQDIDDAPYIDRSEVVEFLQEHDQSSEISDIELDRKMNELLMDVWRLLAEDIEGRDPEMRVEFLDFMSKMVELILNRKEMETYKLGCRARTSVVEAYVKGLSGDELVNFYEYLSGELMSRKYIENAQNIRKLKRSAERLTQNEKIDIISISSHTRMDLAIDLHKDCLEYLDQYLPVIRALVGAMNGDDVTQKNYDACGINSSVAALNGTGFRFVPNYYSSQIRNAAQHGNLRKEIDENVIVARNKQKGTTERFSYAEFKERTEGLLLNVPPLQMIPLYTIHELLLRKQNEIIRNNRYEHT